eukprot:EG_transcript_4136
MAEFTASLCSVQPTYVTYDGGAPAAVGNLRRSRCSPVLMVAGLCALLCGIVLVTATALPRGASTWYWVAGTPRVVPLVVGGAATYTVARGPHPSALRTAAAPQQEEDDFAAALRLAADDEGGGGLEDEGELFEDEGGAPYEVADATEEEEEDEGEEGLEGEADEPGISPEERRRRKKQWSPKLRPTLVARAQAAGFFRPTSAQRRAIPTILAGRDVVIHAETGAGKTLAFLMPLVQKLQPGVAFQAMIVCPSSELAVQTAQVLNKVWDLEGPAVGLVVAGNSPAAQYDGLSKRQPAVVVGSARQLDLMLEDEARRETLLKPMRILVLDEVDALLPPRATELIKELTKKQAKKKFESVDYKERRRLQRIGFTEKDLDLEKVRGKDRRLVEVKPTQRILGYVNLHKARMQLICASATAEKGLVHFLSMRAKKYDSFQKVKVVSSKPVAAPTKGLRSRGVAGVGVPARIQHEAVLNEDGDADQKLRNVLKAYREDRPWSVLMAVGNAESVSGWVEKLRFRGVKGAASLHELMGFGSRESGFRLNAAVHLAKHRELQQRFENRTGDPPFVVTTQINCRGIDLKGVDVVYMTAAPKGTDEYQHLSGRSGREGRVGKALSFLDVSELAQARQIKADLGIKLKVGPEELIPLADAVVDPEKKPEKKEKEMKDEVVAEKAEKKAGMKAVKAERKVVKKPGKAR